MGDPSGESVSRNGEINGHQSGYRGEKTHFNLANYHAKKMFFKEKYVNSIKKLTNNYNKEKRKLQFKNCCMLTFDEECEIKASEVGKTLLLNLKKSLKNISAIAPYESSKKWAIQFKDEKAFKENLDKEIEINGARYTLADANQIRKETIKLQNFTMSVYIRVHWLPTGLQNEIKSFIEEKAKFLTVLEIKSEKWDLQKMGLEDNNEIENGVYSVKLAYDVDDHQNFLNFGGYHRINDFGALIQICGMPVQCIQCGDFGHIRKECPERHEKCSSCQKVGHRATRCWSSRFNNNNNEEKNEDDFIDEEESEKAQEKSDEISTSQTNSINVVLENNDNNKKNDNKKDSNKRINNNDANNIRTQKFDFYENKEINDSQVNSLGEESQTEELTASKIESIGDIVKSLIKKGSDMEIGNKKRKKEFVEELKSLNTSSNSSILSGGSPYSKKIADEKSVIKGGDESMNE